MTSVGLTPASDRVSAFCRWALCPARAENVAFRVVEGEVHAAVAVGAEELPLWVHGCVETGLETRPPWLAELTQELGRAPSGAPQRLRCGAASRLVHVKDGLVVTWGRATPAE